MSITSGPDILRITNYYISYNYDALEKVAEVFISFFKKSIFIKYVNDRLIINNLCDKVILPEEIECPKYASAVIVNYLLKSICSQINYPFCYIVYYENNNRISSMGFEKSKDEQEINKSTAMNIIYNDCIDTGLMPEHIDFAKESDVYDGLIVLVRIWLGVEIA